MPTGYGIKPREIRVVDGGADWINPFERNISKVRLIIGSNIGFIDATRIQ